MSSSRCLCVRVFSGCVIDHVWRLFFPVSDQPICGNLIVEEGEECDVGHDDSDACCYSATHPVGVQCRLKPGKVCRCHTQHIFQYAVVKGS